MKHLKYFLILLFIPFIVLAEECDISKITITSIEQSEINGNTEEISEPTFKDRNINLNLKMYDVDDSITYDLVIKNDSEEDYMIDEDTFKTDSDYIEYTLKTNDNTNVVKAKSTKEVSLIVTYKKEVDDSLLTNNKFNASNTLKLSLNTSEKEQPLDIITTDNIKESLDPKEVKNPVTSVSSMMLISIILLTSIVILYILIKRKKRYTKYLLIVLSMILIPTVYAICKCDIEVESTIEIEKLPKLYDTVIGLSKEPNACATKYEGEVTDEVGKTVNASNVYFDKCTDNRNVIFGGFCWQVVRTTETGGVKMIYNGEPVNGKCESTRGDHKGIVGVTGTPPQTLTASYLYGDSFTYDITNSTFTLTDTFTALWSDSTYEDLIGKYTCTNTTGICSNIYYINGHMDNNYAILSTYSLGTTVYNEIGSSPFNINYDSPAMVGYMFNKVYRSKVLLQQQFDNNTKFGQSFSYNEITKTYTLSGTTQILNTWPSNTNILNNTHYTCWNDIGECNNISYIFNIGSSNYNYINISGGKSVEDALNEMLWDDDVNKYNSNVKGIIDNWYANNLLNKTNMIEDTVYCNARNIKEIGVWNPNGGNNNSSLQFKNYPYGTKELDCPNETDQFAVSNSKAKLKYPIALLQNEEAANNGNLGTNRIYWYISPYDFYNGRYLARVRNAISFPEIDNNVSNIYYGMRPVISLKNNNRIALGTGSESDPWIIK